MSHQADDHPPKQPNNGWINAILVAGLILTLVAGAYLRFSGVNWDEDQHMHPDERFLSLVQVAISPVGGLAEYFDTAASSLNPSNRGYTFFVYGTLPLFIIRYLGDALGQMDYHTITIMGRYASATFDMITILLVYAIGKRLYNRWVGLLGAMFYALAVLPIQLSHYMTVDTFTNTFAFAAVYAAVWALKRPARPLKMTVDQKPPTVHKEDAAEVVLEEKRSFDFESVWRLLRELAPYILFGVFLGAATASKINAVVVALILPLIEWMRYLGLDPEKRQDETLPILRNLIVAGVLSFIVFRIGQPYAFNGPGFFNFGINPEWWASLQNLRVQASGDVDFPPALQWARRPITFSLTNLVRWGLGLPLGVFAWLAYLGMGWQIIRKRNWQDHLPLWAFTGAYFIWQSISWVRSMRYQMLIYPALALIAGWGLVKLWQSRQDWKIRNFAINAKWVRLTGILLTVGILVTTAIWAFPFSGIYTRSHTRVAASRWIYQNIPGAITLEVQTQDGEFFQPLPYRAGDHLRPDMPFRMPFNPPADGVVTAVTFPHIVDQSQSSSMKQVSLTIFSEDAPEQISAVGQVESTFYPLENDWKGTSYEFILERPLSVSEEVVYYIQLELLSTDSSDAETALLLNGSPYLNLITHTGLSMKSPLPGIQQSVRAGSPYTMTVQIVESGEITRVFIPRLVDQSGLTAFQELEVLLEIPNTENGSREGAISGDFSPGEDLRGEFAVFDLSEPLQVEKGQVINISLFTSTQGAIMALNGFIPAHESSWDDAIPYPVDGFSPYSESGGIYRGDLNFEMYWPDDQSKLEKFETNLDLADTIFITSNRQWGTTTRVPERYPLTTLYYRALLGCPEDKDILWCYSVAEPGMFEGDLGFELVAVFQSNPRIGSIEFNTQFAEEAFTVYDHPKVLIFKKTGAYDPLEIRAILRSVDLNKVVYFTPGDANNYKEVDPAQADDPRLNLNLPAGRLKEQRAGGTWSELFDRESLLNSSQPLAAAVFYLFVTILGVFCYPLVRLALPGLSDRGYPLSKLAGLLILALIVWILGSLGVPYSKLTISLVLAGLLGISILVGFLQRKDLWAELKSEWRYFLLIEGLALVAFIFFILIRSGNPDLWHPYKGGEKPMDFSYLNAVLKSTTFPPYDPWFAGGFINYYYYGFVIVATPIKLLGIVPSVAYNIVLPIWYSLLITGSFSVGWNLYQGISRPRALRANNSKEGRLIGMAFWVGLATAIGLAVLGNLGTVKLILRGFQQLASGGAVLEEATWFQHLQWSLQGFGQFITGTPLPFYPGDWYWFPSRVIPGEPITEFPYFTFLYADLHAHLIAFPITVFAVSWSLSVVLNGARWGARDGSLKWLSKALGFVLGGIVIGALRPTNTWDFYTYIVLASIALFYSVVKHHTPRIKLPLRRGDWLEKALVGLGAVLLLVLLAALFYYPFNYWYGQGYTQVKLWEGDRTPLNSYFTHWGLFLFVIISWMAWETYHWMKTTPQSALKRLEPYKTWIITGFFVSLIAMIVLLGSGVSVALVVVPLGVWTVLLMLRPERTDGMRFLLFLIGTALALTLVVELVYLLGDIGRMNTVFKFYLQSWILFALSAGVCFGWTVRSLRYWQPRLSFIWQLIMFGLVSSAFLFTTLGTTDKIRDRMSTDAPTGLDGMTFMASSTYYDMGVEMDLREDYDAILWMQENIEGSPVILEGQAYEYRWGNRFTIYTGLPGVVGWNWHQRQQRTILQNNAVQERVDAVNTFYTTDSLEFVVNFLDQFDVSYIVVGQLEQAFYPGDGLDKFDRYRGELWEEVYRSKLTVIYRVID